MFSIGLRCLLSSLILLPSVSWGQRSEARAEGNQTASSRFIASGGVGLGLDDRANKTRMKLDWERAGRRSLLSWGAPGSSSISRRRHHKAHVERTVDKISGSNPFMLIFTSGSGSSWLWQRLAVTRGVCMLGYEPLADCSTEKSNLERKMGFMRVALATPGGSSDAEKKGRWASWREKLKEKSLPCRISEVKHSFEGARCEATHTFATGFRFRVTRALGRPEKWPLLKACLWEHGTKLIWLKRRNTLQQALAEYNGLLRSAGTTVRGAKNQLDGKSGDVHLEHFDGVLQNVAKRNKDAAKMMEALQVPFHEVFYEDLLQSFDDTMLNLERFLDVGSERVERERKEKPGTYSVAPMIPDHLAITKQTPHDMCDAVSNYEAFCRKYSKEKQWAHLLESPCLKGMSSFELGKCCQCEYRHTAQEESLEKELEQKLASLHGQHESLAQSQAVAPPSAAELEEQRKKQRAMALQVERNRRDDDDMAKAAPGRVNHLDLHVALRNSAKQMPAWMEAS